MQNVRKLLRHRHERVAPECVALRAKKKKKKSPREKEKKGVRGGRFLGPVCVRQGTANGRAFAGKRSRKTKNDQGCVAFRGGCGSFVAQSLSFSVFGCSVSPRSHTVCVCLCLCGLVDEVERWRGVRVACSSEGSPKKKRMARAQEEARNHSRRLSRVKRGKKKTEWGEKRRKTKKNHDDVKRKRQKKTSDAKKKDQTLPLNSPVVKKRCTRASGERLQCSSVLSCMLHTLFKSLFTKKAQKREKRTSLVCVFVVFVFVF